MDSPLNLNLILTFKDNSENGSNIILQNLATLEQNIIERASQLEAYKNSLFEDFTKLEIVIRNHRSTLTICWREKKPKNYRDYYRLNSNQLSDCIESIRGSKLEWLFEIEKEVLILNGNLKLISWHRSILKNTQVELEEVNRYICKLQSKKLILG